MTRQTIDHFPVDQLPDALCGSFKAGEFVRITLEHEIEKNLSAILSFVGQGSGIYPTPEDAVSAMREVREEWKI